MLKLGQDILVQLRCIGLPLGNLRSSCRIKVNHTSSDSKKKSHLYFLQLRASQIWENVCECKEKMA